MSARAHPANPQLAALLARLQGVKAQGRGYVACCPAHGDDTPSLSVSEGRDGRVVTYCHAGCTFPSIASALGLEEADFFPPKPTNGAHGTNGANGAAPYTPPRQVAHYDYVDADGALRYQVVRYEPKDFRQRRPDGNGGWLWTIGDVEPVLYRLPEVLAAVAAHRPVFVVEGEKDADALAALGYVATTNAGGAKKWREAFGAVLAGAHGNEVIVLPDHDDAGRAHAAQVAATCGAKGSPVRVVTLPDLPPKGDVSDWLAAGGTLDALDALIEATPLWQPARPATGLWRLDDLWADPVIMRPPTVVIPRLAWEKRCTMLASAEKSGKSTKIGYLATAVSRGGDYCGEPCNGGRPGTVVIYGLEEFVGDCARRLKEFGADPTRVFIRDALGGTPDERLAQVRQDLDAVRPVVAFIDTLIAYSGGTVSDASSSAQMGPMVQAITDLAHASETAIILCHHARKSDGRYRDSSAIGGAVDVIAEMFAPDPDADPSKRVLRVKGRVPTADYAVRWDGHDYRLANATGPAPLEDRICDVLRRNPGSSLRALRDAVGGRGAETDLAVDRLLTSGLVVDHGTGAARAYSLAPTRPNDRRAPQRDAFGPAER